MSLDAFARLFLLGIWEGGVGAWGGRRRIFAAAAMGALVCGATQAAGGEILSFERRAKIQETSKAETSGGGRTVTDETGRRVAVPAEVRRIVTLAPNLTETIYALGVEDRLAGDTEYCDTPPAAKTKPHVGAPVNPSLEAIVALHPDLVLATTSINRRETVDALLRLGVAVYTSNPHTVRGMLESIGRMAELIGPLTSEEISRGAPGAAIVAGLQAKLDALHGRMAELPLTHVLFVVWMDPLITIGQNTFIADALRWAGAESVVLSKQNWPQLSMEEVVRLQPEYIVLTSDHAESGAEQLIDLRARPAWKELDAVKRGHVAVMSEEVTRPAPGLIESIELLARELHAPAFATGSEGQSANRETRKEAIECAR